MRFKAVQNQPATSQHTKDITYASCRRTPRVKNGNFVFAYCAYETQNSGDPGCHSSEAERIITKWYPVDAFGFKTLPVFRRHRPRMLKCYKEEARTGRDISPDNPNIRQCISLNQRIPV